MDIKQVFIESPYSGDIEANVKYARQACTHSYEILGEAPIALHLLYTQLPEGDFISDNGPKVLRGREFALQCCATVRGSCDLVAFYVDKGWSEGMKRAKEECIKEGIRFEERRIFNP